jgi:hypothetical protein
MRRLKKEFPHGRGIIHPQVEADSHKQLLIQLTNIHHGILPVTSENS